MDMYSSNPCIASFPRSNIRLPHQLLYKQDVIKVYLPRQFIVFSGGGGHTRTSADFERLWSGSWALMIRRMVPLGYAFVMASFAGCWIATKVFTLYENGMTFTFL